MSRLDMSSSTETLAPGKPLGWDIRIHIHILRNCNLNQDNFDSTDESTWAMVSCMAVDICLPPRGHIPVVDLADAKLSSIPLKRRFLEQKIQVLKVYKR